MGGTQGMDYCWPGNQPVQHIDPSRMSSDTAVKARFLAVELCGTPSFVSVRRTDGACDLERLLPEGFVIDAQCKTNAPSGSLASAALVARGRGSTVLLELISMFVVIRVAGTTMRGADELADDILARAPIEKPPDSVPIATWHSNGMEHTRKLRRIEAPTWAAVARNYPPRVRNALTELFSLQRPRNRGKLVLWHGEPGTGKTTALRAMIREWKEWANAHYIADPERLFADTGYLTEVISPGFGSAESAGGQWRLVIAEDSDEYLKASARRESGAALGRLLNMSDGILGQGTNALIVLTTNERLDRLHPALTRPGRCLAEVEFARFSVEEGRDWLGDGSQPPAEPLTLADLIERTCASRRIISVPDDLVTIGNYL